MLFVRIVAAAAVLVWSGCGEKTASNLDALRLRAITLPGGQEILAEVMLHPMDQARGMMFRDSLEPRRGMLFIHDRPGHYTYWMYQVRIPLDILWLDSSKRIVEISANTPPCRTQASECPHYGGRERAQYVLELAGGMAEKYGLKTGQTLVF